MLGAQAVAKAFPEYPTTIVKVHEPAIHLKDYISMAGPEVLAIAKTQSAQKTFQVLIGFLCLYEAFGFSMRVAIIKLRLTECIIYRPRKVICYNSPTGQLPIDFIHAR